jgi:hypothetical protein
VEWLQENVGGEFPGDSLSAVEEQMPALGVSVHGEERGRGATASGTNEN